MNDEAKTDEQKNCLSKLTFATRELAGAAVAYAGWQYGDKDSKARPYRCRHCGKWHLARSHDS